MPEPIINLFHPIEVDKSDQERLASSISQFDLVLRQREKSPAIVKPGQIIIERQVQQFYLYPLPFDGVAEGPPDRSPINVSLYQVIFRACIPRLSS